MTERETEQAKEIADIIVEKFRHLFALESRILEAREQTTQAAANRDTTEPAEPQDTLTPEDEETLTTLETQMKVLIEEMEEFIDALKSEIPSLRTYILPRMHRIVETLKADTPAEPAELIQLVNTLTAAGDPQSLEQLAAVIIIRLRENLERTFSM